MGVHVKVVDRSDIVGKVASASRLDEIYMTSALSMVVNVTKFLRAKRPYSRFCAPGVAQSARISRLDIVDHGNSTSVQLGSDRVNVGNFDTAYRAILLPLAMHFERDGFAHIQNCQAGQNEPLLEKFADTWGVPVVAGTGNDYEAGLFQFNWGDYVRVYPSRGNGRPEADVLTWRP